MRDKAVQSQILDEMRESFCRYVCLQGIDCLDCFVALYAYGA